MASSQSRNKTSEMKTRLSPKSSGSTLQVWSETTVGGKSTKAAAVVHLSDDTHLEVKMKAVVDSYANQATIEVEVSLSIYLLYMNPIDTFFPTCFPIFP